MTELLQQGAYAAQAAGLFAAAAFLFGIGMGALCVSWKVCEVILHMPNDHDKWPKPKGQG